MPSAAIMTGALKMDGTLRYVLVIETIWLYVSLILFVCQIKFDGDFQDSQ